MTFFKILLPIVWAATISANDLPSFIHVCHRTDPNLEACLMAAVEDIRPHLITGVAEYNIPSIEPLILKDLISEDVAGMKITTSNVAAYGCSDFSVRGISHDSDQMVYTLQVDIPKLRITADYSVDGKILLVPVKGNGNLEGNITDCVSTFVIRGQLVEKDGQNYLKFTSSDLSVKVGGGQVRVENLFNGDKILLGMVNDVVNKNLDAFLKELMPVIEKALSQTFLEIANDIVDPFTYDQLFPQ